MNYIHVVGKISSDIKLNHYIENNDYYEFTIDTKRLSLVDDKLTIVCLGKMVREHNINKDDFIDVVGEIRTVNKNGHVKVYVYPLQIKKSEDPYCDEVQLIGNICKKSERRSSPLGREITDFIISVNRQDNKKADYIPVIVWNSVARKTDKYQTGDSIYIKGRLQSRNYTKDEMIRTTIELSANEISRI